ncbi:hypothetical protein BH24ACT6_BH24ACT6_06600 [soil metagenome]
MIPSVPITIAAFNTATASSNKIHDDDVARSYGFGGGLVPGVDVFAYLTQPAAESWGADWLGAGRISARFARPVYDGEVVTVDAEPTPGDETMRVELRGPDDTIRATADVWRSTDGSAPDDSEPLPDVRPLPAQRPPASAAALAPGTVLGSLHDRFDADAATSYLDDVRDDGAPYREQRLAHPGWLLRRSNSVLAANIELGPWIHVASDVRFHAVVEDGDEIEVRAAVSGEFERGGHRFVTLDVALVAPDGGLVQRVTHTAIHTPRPAAGGI